MLGWDTELLRKGKNVVAVAGSLPMPLAHSPPRQCGAARRWSRRRAARPPAALGDAAPARPAGSRPCLAGCPAVAGSPPPVARVRLAGNGRIEDFGDFGFEWAQLRPSQSPGRVERGREVENLGPIEKKW